MKNAFVYKRKTRKLRWLKFKCPRCGAKFITHLSNCQFDYGNDIYDHVTKNIVCGFTRIRTSCPDCKETVQYGYRIDISNNGEHE